MTEFEVQNNIRRWLRAADRHICEGDYGKARECMTIAGELVGDCERIRRGVMPLSTKGGPS